MRARELDLFYWSTRLAILFVLPLYISDVGLYEEYGKNFLLFGKIPYLDWDFEYPPLAYPFMALPALIQQFFKLTDTESFRVIFGLLLLPFDLWIYLSFRRRPPYRQAPFYYILLTGFLCLLLFDRFDIAVGFMLAFPFLSGRSTSSDLRFALSWGLGGALKLVPLFLVPLPLLQWKRLCASRLVRYGALAALPILLSCLGVSLLTHGKIPFLSHHAQRGVQIESLLASVVFFRQTFFSVGSMGVDSNFGAQHMSNSPEMVALSRAILWGSLGATYLFLWWQRRRWCALSASWLVISGFVTFGYVLSPQFLLWLLPLGICAAERVAYCRRSHWLCLLAFAAALTGAHFRYYWNYVQLQQFATAMVLTRNLSLVLLWCLSWRWMNQDGPRLVPAEAS